MEDGFGFIVYFEKFEDTYVKKRHNQVSEFPFDAVRVELKFPGGSMTAIDTIARILMHVFLDCSVSFSSHKKSAFRYF